MEPEGKSQEQEGELGYYNSNTYKGCLFPSIYFVSATEVRKLFTHISSFATTIFQSSIRVQILAKHLS